MPKTNNARYLTNEMTINAEISFVYNKTAKANHIRYIEYYIIDEEQLPKNIIKRIGNYRIIGKIIFLGAGYNLPTEQSVGCEVVEYELTGRWRNNNGEKPYFEITKCCEAKQSIRISMRERERARIEAEKKLPPLEKRLGLQGKLSLQDKHAVGLTDRLAQQEKVKERLEYLGRYDEKKDRPVNNLRKAKRKENFYGTLEFLSLPDLDANIMLIILTFLATVSAIAFLFFTGSAIIGSLPDRIFENHQIISSLVNRIDVSETVKYAIFCVLIVATYFLLVAGTVRFNELVSFKRIDWFKAREAILRGELTQRKLNEWCYQPAYFKDALVSSLFFFTAFIFTKFLIHYNALFDCIYYYIFFA